MRESWVPLPKQGGPLGKRGQEEGGRLGPSLALTWQAEEEEGQKSPHAGLGVAELVPS